LGHILGVAVNDSDSDGAFSRERQQLERFRVLSMMERRHGPRFLVFGGQFLGLELVVTHFLEDLVAALISQHGDLRFPR